MPVQTVPLVVFAVQVLNTKDLIVCTLPVDTFLYSCLTVLAPMTVQPVPLVVFVVQVHNMKLTEF